MFRGVLNFFKKSPLKTEWHFTKNPKFVGAKGMAVVCSLNENHILFSCKENYYMATPKTIEANLWNTLSSVAMDDNLVARRELNETCDRILSSLALEAETAGLHGVDMD